MYSSSFVSLLVRLASCATVIVLTLADAQAQSGGANPHAPDTPESGSVEAIAKYTTDPKFLSSWVAYVPVSASVPSPTKYLNRLVGTPGELTRTTQIYGYMRELDKASPRVQVSTIGKTEEGRDILLVAIADEAGLRDLDKLKAATAALADPRKTTPEQAEQIIATARPIYYFNAGLHSTELGSPEMVMELAFRLAVSEQPMIQRIRRNLLVLINPVSEPDGRDKAVDWFYRYQKGKTDPDNLPPGPPYWGHYVFHDNNRDTHQKALEITRAVHRMFYDYHPTVVHDLHESIPLLHTWNGTGPFNTNLDPILINEWFEMAFAEIRTMSSLGMPGVWTWGFGEGWGHHYLDSVAVNHNAMGRGYETFGNGTAETIEQTMRTSEDRDAADKPVTSREWYRPWPPDRKFKWSMRNNTNYMQTGCLAILDYTARSAPEMLRGFYRKSYNSWQKGVKEKPYAFAIPSDQGDRRRVAQMIELLQSHKIEVGRARAAFTVAEGSYPAGTFVVRLDQPYRNYAVDLLAPQKFPTDTPFTPYDDVSWSLPVHYGVEAKAIADEKIKGVPLDPAVAEAAAGRVEGSGAVFLLRDTGQEALLAARVRLASLRVDVAERAFSSGGRDYPAGSWIIRSQPGDADALGRVARELSLDFQGAASAPDVPRHEIPLPRLAVWHTWDDTESVGWIRYTLDRDKIPYTYIRDDDIRTGGLRGKYDVILFGNNYLSLQGQIHGIDKRWGPMPYTKTPEFQSHGVPDASNDITGGIGWAGVANLARFLEEGGLLVTLANGSALALEGGLVRGVSRAAGNVSTPGSELRVTFTQPDHPLAYGYPKMTSAFRSSYTVYEVRRGDRGRVVMQWGTKPRKDDREEEDKEKPAGSQEPDAKEKAKKDEQDLVVSGGAKNGDDLEGRPAIIDVQAGRGRVIAYNFNPMHRDMNRSDFRFLWNAILNWKHLLERK
jgi:Zinc carboxypeptidase